MEEVSRIFEMRVPRTVIGINASKCAGSIARKLGAKKIIIITDPGVMKVGLANKVSESLKNENLAYTIFSQCLPNAPLSGIYQCCKLIQDEKVNLIIGIGGGTVMDTVKLAGLLATNDGDFNVLFDTAKIKARSLPRILIPTTSGTGSEWSNVAVFTNESDKRKVPIRSDHLWVDAAIIDPLLTLNLPPSVTAETGMDALSHAIEAYTSWKANVITDALAEKAISLISDNLRIAYARGSKHVESRYNMSIAAGLAVLALRSSGSYIVHSFSYPLCNWTTLSHGAACSLMLPPVMGFNLIGNMDKFAKIARLMGEKTDGLSLQEQAQKSIEAVRHLSMDLSLKQSLGEAGISENDIPQIVDYVFQFHMYQIENNPRNLSREDARQILLNVI
jgi:alcohol dehydrogenase